MEQFQKIPGKTASSGPKDSMLLTGAATDSRDDPIGMENRNLMFQDSEFVEILTSIYCSRNGAGVVFVRDRYGSNPIWAHYFAPGSDSEILRSTQLTGNHQIIQAIRDFKSREL